MKNIKAFFTFIRMVLLSGIGVLFFGLTIIALTATYYDDAHLFATVQNGRWPAYIGLLVVIVGALMLILRKSLNPWFNRIFDKKNS